VLKSEKPEPPQSEETPEPKLPTTVHHLGFYTPWKRVVGTTWSTLIVVLGLALLGMLVVSMFSY